MNKKATISILLILTIVLSACSGAATATTVSGIDTDSALATAVSLKVEELESVATPEIVEVDYEAEVESGDELDLEGSTLVSLNGDSVSIDGLGATAQGSIVTITSGGTYQFSGTLDDGQILVDSADEEDVTLYLNGVNLTSLSSAPIYVLNARNVIITLAEGSTNIVTDAAEYNLSAEEDEPNAAIFSKDDLKINGDGELFVYANFNNGIQSKDDLKITSGSITVSAVNEGLKGKDSVEIKGGTIIIASGADGIQSTNAEEAEKGYVLIEDGNISIVSAMDGIQAETSLKIDGGVLNIISGGGSVSTSAGGFGVNGPNDLGTADGDSAKGLKGVLDLTINGGTITISSLDDALHSNGTVTLNGGEITAASGDDGVHADSSLTINNGSLTITQSYEGLESALIVVNNGYVHVTASDDGLNGLTGTGDMGGMGGIGGGSAYVEIHGGYLYINASGDGLDSNGGFEMSGGVVLVNGPSDNGNGPLDYLSNFTISGGFLVAVGSSGMAQAPSADSSQYSVLLGLGYTYSGGTTVNIQTDSGENILTFVPARDFSSVLVSSADLANGQTLVVSLGGSVEGETTDGLLTSGTYNGGTEIGSLTISSVVTAVGTTGNMGGQPGGGGGKPGGGGPGGKP